MCFHRNSISIPSQYQLPLTSPLVVFVATYIWEVQRHSTSAACFPLHAENIKGSVFTMEVISESFYSLSSSWSMKKKKTFSTDHVRETHQCPVPALNIGLCHSWDIILLWWDLDVIFVYQGSHPSLSKESCIIHSSVAHQGYCLFCGGLSAVHPVWMPLVSYASPSIPVCCMSASTLDNYFCHWELKLS